MRHGLAEREVRHEILEASSLVLEQPQPRNRDPAPHYEHSAIGHNYRLSNLLAAVGRAQLRVLEDRVAARRRNFQFYEEHLRSIEGIEFAPEAPYGGRNAWLTCILVDEDRFGAS